MLGILLLAPPAMAEWQNFRGARDGLADNQVLSILEDAEGGLWFGTPRGASHFDGARWFTEVDSLVPNGTASPNVLSMLRDRTGRLWFGTPAGLACYDGETWRRYSTADVLPSNAVAALLEDHRGEIWIGTTAGLVRHDPGLDTWTTITASPSGLVYSNAWRLIEDRTQRLWVATPEGVGCLDSTRTQWTRYVADPAALARDSVLALAEDAAGNLWFGTDAGVFRLREGQWTWFRSDSGLASDPVTTILPTRAGPVWFGGFSGLSRFDGQVWRQIARTSDGQALGQVLALHEDTSGNLWIGTYAAGLFRYDGVSFRNYFSLQTTATCTGRGIQNAPFQYTLHSNCLTGMLEDRRGELWFGTEYGGVSRYDRRGRWSTLRRGVGQPIPDSLSAILEDASGQIWFASPGAGVVRLDGTRTAWQAFDRAGGLAADTVHTLHQDRRGHLWAGTATGASRWDGNSWASFLTDPGFFGEGIAVLGVLEDARERVWLRTSEGLFSVDSARVTVRAWTTADGLPDDVVQTLRLGRDGQLWAGTAGGPASFVGLAWVPRPGHGLSNPGVNGLLEDSRGRWWITTSSGVAYFQGGNWTTFPTSALGGSPFEFTERGLFEDDRGSIWVSTYAGAARWNGDTWRTLDSRGDGLASDQVRSFLEDRRGTLWMAGNGGLTEHEIDRVSPQTLFLSGPEPLTPSQNANIVFGAAYGEAADVEFSSAWDGGGFSPWSTEVTWIRTGIPDGPHELIVRSREWLRNEDTTAAVYRFVVDATPPPAILSAPTFGQAVRGNVEVRGTAADPRFRALRLEWRPAGTAGWTGPGVVPIDSSTTPVPAVSVITRWDTTLVPEGAHDLRLGVADDLGLVGYAQVRVFVDNQPPFVEVTAPVRVNALEGGDVYSTLGEVRLSFPPRAFDEDALVTINAEVVAGFVVPGWDIAWSAPALRKPVTLEMALPPGAAASPHWAIHRRTGDETWERVGGTLDDSGSRLAVAITEPGAYALRDVEPPAGGTGGLSALAIAPRVLVLGAVSSGRTAISFSLARSAPVTIAIYNRAGRRVRELLAGEVLGAGGNLVYWDGRDRDGNLVEPDLYLVGVEALGDVLQRPVGVMRR